ncbi:MAG: hypothetical protein JXD19_03365 [Deltaproteobacteria bacterium]|nr:hypothetical protein [Deltaproteobacteria bacterium]
MDEKRFYPDAMNYLVKRAQAMTRLKVLSLETRPEYLKKRLLEEMVRKTNADIVDTTVGFETQDDRIRNAILGKNMQRSLLEEKIRLLGRLGVRLTSYVMLKPGPLMTEEEGIREALATVDYLQAHCQRAHTALVIYLSPTYIARGSPLAGVMRRVGYRPPKIQSVLKTIIEITRRGIAVYTGLWCENLAEDKGDFSGRDDYDPRIRNVVKEFNKTQDFSLVEPYKENIEETVRDDARSKASH